MEKTEMLGAIEIALKEAKGSWDETRKKEVEALELKIKALEEGKELSEKEFTAIKKEIDDLDIKFQEEKKTPKAPQNFKTAFKNTLEKNKDLLKGYAGLSSGSRGKVDEKFNLLEFSASLFKDISSGNQRLCLLARAFDRNAC